MERRITALSQGWRELIQFLERSDIPHRLPPVMPRVPLAVTELRILMERLFHEEPTCVPRVSEVLTPLMLLQRETGWW